MKLCKNKLHTYDSSVRDHCYDCKLASNNRYNRKNAEKLNARTRRNYNANPAKKLAQNTIWAKAHPSYHAFKQGKRRAKKLLATPKWLSEYQLRGIRLNYEMAQYLTHLLGTRMVVDHIIPLQGKIVSGLHVPWNLQIMEFKANSKKNNKVEE